MHRGHGHSLLGVALMQVDVKPAALAGPPPTRLECKLFADRFGADLLEDLHSNENMRVGRASWWLFGCRDWRDHEPN